MNNELLKLDNQLCFRLYQVSRQMTRIYQPYLKEFNLTYPQYIVMLVMFEHEALDFHDLSKIVDLKTGTLTPIINNLVTHGYIQKVVNENDKRRVTISLTEKGKQLEEEVISVPLKMAEELEIDEDMYKILVKELDDLKLILTNAQGKK